MNITSGVSRVLGGILDVTSACLTMAIVGITLAQVFSRYVLESSLIWSDELNRLLFVWLIATAAASARHMRIELLVESFALRSRQVLGVFALGVSLACLSVLAYGAQSLWSLLRYDTYTGLPVSPALLFVAVFIGSALWATLLIAQAIAQSGDISDAPVVDKEDL